MANYVVVYDLKRPGQNYPDLIKHLESYPTHWHFQLSGWIIGPAEGAYEVAEAARQFLDARDLLFVQQINEDSAWWGYDQEGSDWILEIIG